MGQPEVIHLVEYFVGGLPHTKCGIYAGKYNITAFHKEVTCRRCIKMFPWWIKREFIAEVMEA